MTTEPSSIRISEDCELAMRMDDYTQAWDARPPMLMLHGLAESGEAFRRWVPHFAGHHRVIRPDLRGFGDSTPMAADYHYRFDQLGNDVMRLLDSMKLERVFVVGAKIGGTLALHLAARHPERVLAVAAIAAPASLTSFDERAPSWRKQIREQGVQAWVRETTEWRLGTSLPRVAVDWWVELMSRTSASTLEAFLQMVPTVDVTGELPAIAAPTVVVTTTGSGLATVDAVRAWQQTIPGSVLEVLPGDSYHVAATHPDDCAAIVRRYFDGVAVA